jgi:heparinase II/III-like protein
MKAGYPFALLPLVGHKVLQRVHYALDERGGYARAQRLEQDLVGRLVDNNGAHPVAEWLSRPEAGRFWLPVRAARRWARAHCTDADLAWAEAVVAGRYSLLGAQAAELGNPPRWHRDLYSGVEWPLGRASRMPLARGDGSDIRTVWELSRCYHFVGLAKAYWRTGDPRFCTTFRGHVESWLDSNPTGFGANWRSPMDAAIRAANWTLAMLLFAEAGSLSSEFWIRLLTNLRVTARFVARHLEWHPLYRGNHYLSNAVGLIYVGALFRDDPSGAAWLRKGVAILRREIDYQVCSDGVSGEASIGYHRLVTEFFTYGGEIAEANLPGFLPAAYWRRLRSMYEFLAAYLDLRGNAPLLGDADDGRLHLLCADAADQPRAHRLGLRPRYWPGRAPGSAAFREGGFYVLRSPRGHCIVRCGPLGLHGAGSHDHNDQLAYELSLDGAPLISDSGTYAYTRDLSERYAFRSTAAHNAVQIAEDEQNPIRADRPWRVLADRTRSRCTEWVADAEGARFTGRHAGFSRRSSRALCYRTVSVTYATEGWTVRDRIEGKGTESIAWRTHFAPGKLSARSLSPTTWTIEHTGLPGTSFLLESSLPLQLQLEASRVSERYGVWQSRPMLVLRGAVALPLEITLRVRPLLIA